MKRATLVIVALVLIAGALQAQVPKPAPDPWGPVSFLVGEWSGLGSGSPGEGVGGATFAFALNKSVLMRKTWNKFDPKPGEKKGISHEDMMIIYPGAPGEPALRAIYFDMERHVIHYDLLPAAKPGTAVFTSDATQKGPRYRLGFELGADGKLLNTFSIAMPGQDFKEYVRGWLTKK